MKDYKLQGNKGGSAPPAIEVDDTITSSGKAYIVDLLCEGEIDSLVNLYIDEARYTASDFPTVEFDSTENFRTGKQRTEQTRFKKRFAGAKVPLPIPASNRLRKTRPITLAFNSNTYPDATSVLVNVRFPGMIRQVSKENKNDGENVGDIRETTVQYEITLTENGGNRSTITEVVRQKSSGGFIWSTRVQLNPNASLLVNHWKLKIERITEDSKTVKISNDTYLDSVIIETDYNYNYPNTALASLAFDAQNFPTVGQRAYDLKLLKVKVPTGYTPTQFNNAGDVTAAAVYPATWNGTFSSTKVWTNNPAWIFYDILTNRRYGLGEFISESSIDKWTLYSIARYCDELIDRGSGESGLKGKEPRFACNLFLTTSEEAYTVINNLASVFRGLTYWMSGKIFPIQDRPKETVQLFTNANVLNGIFNYSSTGKSQRRTVCQVRWNDPEDFFRPKVEYVEDTDGVIKFGVRDFDLGAFACTSRGQAYRVGKWALLSEQLETEVVNFEVGFEGVYSRPGDIIEVYDDLRFNQKQGGRTYDVVSSNNRIVLDRIVETGANLNYKLALSIPKANRDPAYTGSDSTQLVTSTSQTGDIRKPFIEVSNVTNIYYSGDKTVCDVSPAFSERYVGGTWILQASHPTSGVLEGTKKYRIMNVKETEEKNIGISALEYDTEKFNIAETGFTIRISPTTDYSASPINPPSGLILETVYNLAPNAEVSFYIQASWTPSDGTYVANHIASGRNITGGPWQSLQVFNNASSARYLPTQSGEYEIAVRAVQVGGKVSSIISDTIIFGASSPLSSVMPVSGVYLVNPVFGQPNQYNDREPTFGIRLSGSGDFDVRSAFLKGLDIKFFNQTGGAASEWYRVGEDEDVTIPYISNVISGWPFRTGSIQVRAVDFWDNYSATKSFSFSNPPPPRANLSVLSKTENSFSYILEPYDEMPTDYSGTLFWTSKTTTKPTGYTVKNGTAGELVHNLNSDTVYAWWALADTFSLNELQVNGPVALEVGTLALPAVGLQLGLSGHVDNWNNEHWTLYSSWNRFESGNIRDYIINLEDNSGSKYTYITPQSDSGSKPFFHFDSVTPDRDYRVRVRGRNSEGRLTAFSSYSLAVNVPKPKIRFLQVEGKSYFFEPTYVRVSSQNVSTSQNIDYGQGNILRVNLSNGSAITLGAQNIQSGSTYLIYMLRQAGAGAVNFSSNYKWPDGEAPDISTDAGFVDVISAFAIDSGNLYCVAVNNMS